ncbi:rab escort protein [Rhodotorula toruloides]|uniref:Rab escort protein n=1 Tax=Rhodotorula toruloides TaxID=5286 RepID=A0A511K8C8_RHOTO|nr:rab escort protein [Rhodotorula toruloides]
MDPNEPTHFNVLIAGRGYTSPSSQGPALSKAGYSVLQLDSAPYYGTEHASLSLTELHDWASSTRGAEPSSPSPPADLSELSQRFALSLYPFGLLGGVGLWQDGERGVARVPASKADVFNDATLSLVEKRRLTKLLLFAAGEEPFEEDKDLKAYSLTGVAASSLAYALALCSSHSDRALPALRRIRSIIHAVGRYGPSPFLVGHYGGAGDLVGGFSRICAVWGGGQILGRPLLPLNPSATRGVPVPTSQPPFLTATRPPPPPPSSTTTSATTALGIPVLLSDEPGAETTTFTADWVVCSPHLFSTLFPSHPAPASLASDAPRSVRLIAILARAVPFPRPPAGDPSAEEEEEHDGPDSQLFVFPPNAFKAGGGGGVGVELGTVTALQTGKGTMTCPRATPQPFMSSTLLNKPYDAFADEGADEEVVVETKSKKQQQSNHIHIRIQQRNGRKTITTLQGVPTEYDLKKLLKAFKKEFACNGAIIEDEDLGKVIQLQGDQRTKIQEMLIEEGIEKDTIKMHGF